MPQQAAAGFGLRAGHYARILEAPLSADIAEIVTENFMNRGGRPRAVVEKVRGQMPVITHGVGLSLGSTDPLDQDYLRSLAGLISFCEPLFVSDHLCFSSVGGHRAYDLWPLPYTEEACRHVSQRIREVQERLGRRLVIENVSSYAEYQSSEVTEAQFLKEVLQEADCLCLLDVNNVYVSASNHDFDPRSYVETIPKERVAYYHLAGHTDYGTHILDDHGSEVPEPVWDLFDHVLAVVGQRPTIVEWDSQLPELETVAAQADLARTRMLQASGARTGT